MKAATSTPRPLFRISLLKKHGGILAMLLFGSFIANALTITTGTISPATICAGAVISVPYTVSAPFNAGNQFSVQLSDASGVFPALTPNIISSPVTAVDAGTISATIPVTTPFGTGYRIRVIGTDPSVAGSDNGADITINPIPDVSLVAPQTLCAGTSTAAIAFTGSVAGTTFTWANNTPGIGLAASGAGNIPSFATANTTTAPITGTITVTPSANGCTGTATNVTSVTVNPIPTVDLLIPQSVCNGAATAAVTFSGPVAGTTFAWANSNTDIGLLASGVTAVIPSFLGINLTATPITGTITVTPSANGCTGAATNVTSITVNPVPTVNPVAAQSLCGGANTAAISFTGAVGGTVFNWVNSNNGIGLAGSGTGNIASFATANPATSITGTITVTPTVNGCTGTATAVTSITVNPAPSVNLVVAQTVCKGASTAAISFTGSVPGSTFTWTNNTPGIGLAGGGTGNIASFTATNTTTAPLTGTITVTPSAAGCPGVATTVTSITVNPAPVVNTVAAQSVCNGANVAAISLTTPVTGVATSYAWTNSNASIGLGTSGTGNIPSFTAANGAGAPITGTVTVTPSIGTCAGIATAVTAITVNPTPVVNAITGQTVCNGTSAAAVSFTGAVAGTTYTWTNNTAGIGLAGSGSGNIASFTATNATAAPVTATITATPSANGCTGAATAVTAITVNPTPSVAAVTAQTVCKNTSTTAISFTGPVAGTTYGWTNSNTAIGLAGSGSGNIPFFTGTNTGTSPITGTITVTPTANGCGGAATAVTSITVNPAPTVNTVAAQAVCNGASTAAISFTTAVTGATTTYAWTNSNTAIGLAGSGSGNIASFIAANAGSAPVSGTIAVTPSIGACAGTATTVTTVTVNPTPAVNAIAPQTLCNGASTAAITFTGPVSGTTYSWVNSNTAIGLGPNGTTSVIPSFTATNSTNTPVSGTITATPAANGCTGSLTTVTSVSVNPTPAVNTVAAQSICNGTAASSITLSGPVTGTTFAWTNSAPSIGLATSGTGNFIPSFTGSNGSSNPVTGTIQATATANGCTGPTTSVTTITVNPIPTVNTQTGPSANQIVCAGSATLPINFVTSATAPTTYVWSNNTTAINLAGTGSGNIPAFITTNNTNGDITATITVTPSIGSCQGASVPVTNITVRPNPTITPVTNSTAAQTVCNGTSTAAILLAGPVTGSSFTWSRSGLNIGLANSGQGNVPAFFATAPSGVNVQTKDTIMAMPSIPLNPSIPALGTCYGTPTTVATITVNPTPTVNTQASQPPVCNAQPTLPVVFTSPQGALTSFTWYNSNTAINLADSGLGNIPVFTAANPTSTSSSASNITGTITVRPYITLPTSGVCTGTLTNVTSITVKPSPKLISSLTPPATCDSIVFNYTPASNVTGTTYTWSRSSVTGISNPFGSGTGSISEILHNLTDTNVVVTYRYIMTANACMDSVSVRDSIKPTPRLTSAPPLPVCDSALFTFQPLSPTAGTTFAWTRASIIGISNAAGSGTGVINEYLHNTTDSIAKTVNYIETLNASGCISTKQVPVTVYPSPHLRGTLTDTLCSGVPYDKQLISSAAPFSTTRFAWTRPALSGITPVTGNSTDTSGRIRDTLFNSTLVAIPVKYYATLTTTIGNCRRDSQVVSLLVNPVPRVPVITTHPPSTLCANVLYQNFGVDEPVVTDTVEYRWRAVNAVIWAQSPKPNRQYALVNFPMTSGISTVTIEARVIGIKGGDCFSSASFRDTITSQVSPALHVIYYNKHFICEDNTQDTYLWGYDQVSNLDSTLTQTHETNQDYFEPSPDFANRYYWVMTSKGGCTQKTYYNTPTAIQNVAATPDVHLKVYPNPVQDALTVELKDAVPGTLTVEITDMTGRKVRTAALINNRLQLSLGDLVPGYYLLGCYRDGIRISTARFIKN